MKAKLLPLSGKYYGTRIEIEFDNGITEEIRLWDNGDFRRSDRELEMEGITREQMENNEVIENDGIFGEVRAQDKMEICDSHFESQSTYLNALALVDAINKGILK